MTALKKYNYRLKTISKLVLSPREHQDHYLAAGDFELEQVKQTYNTTAIGDAESIKIIYPFYQYGSYDGYSPQKTQYYIPGSSIKGAICSGLPKTTTFNLMVDDVTIASTSSLQLNHLYKLQHASNSNEKQGKLELFFPNVAVEMLDVETECVGELFYDQTDLEVQLETAQNRTIDRLKLLCSQINSTRELLLNDSTREALESLLNNVQRKISEAQTNTSRQYLLLLGGFKGLALSSGIEQGIDKSAIYIDYGTILPHGLIQFTLE